MCNSLPVAIRDLYCAKSLFIVSRPTDIYIHSDQYFLLPLLLLLLFLDSTSIWSSTLTISFHRSISNEQPIPLDQASRVFSTPTSSPLDSSRPTRQCQVLSVSLPLLFRDAGMHHPSCRPRENNLAARRILRESARDRPPPAWHRFRIVSKFLDRFMTERSPTLGFERGRPN